jgi:hypothetical protein
LRKEADVVDTYDLATPVGQVRLLLNDVTTPYVFTDGELTAFLTLEGDSVKRAAAQAIDANASSEVLAAKVLRTQDVATDGAKVADALRKHADRLRAQADADDDGFFSIVDPVARCQPELTEFPVY